MSKNKWQCHCGKEVKTKKDLIAHARKKHPHDGASILWDIMHDVGDDFANAGMQDLQNRLAELNAAQKTLDMLKKDYNKLANDYNQVARAVQGIQLIILNAVEATVGAKS